LFAAVSVGALSVGAARAQQAGNSAQPLPPVEVTAKKSKTTKHKREAGAKQTTSPANVNSQNNSSVTTSSAITAGGTGASAVTPTYHTENANLGPLGNKSILDTPTSITVIPQELIQSAGPHGQ
jgi:iron complex outermembrane recepter protein